METWNHSTLILRKPQNLRHKITSKLETPKPATQSGNTENQTAEEPYPTAEEEPYPTAEEQYPLRRVPP